MTLKLAFAGTGSISKIHAQAAQKLPQVALAAVVNHRPESMTAFADAFNIPRRYAAVEDLLREGGVDALVVSTPNYLHAPQTIAALHAGVHVLVEKPMAMNAEEARIMEAASRDSGALLMLAHNWRFHEEVRWMREQVQAGRLGRIIRTKGYSVHVNWGPSGWFTRKSLAGGGALSDMGIHAIDTARYLLGDPLPKSVYAQVGTHYLDGERGVDAAEIVDDTDVLLITWQDGSTSYIESGWWQPHSEGAEAAARLYGTSGYGSVFPTRLQLRDPDGRAEQIADPGYPDSHQSGSVQAMYERQMATFVDCVMQDRQPMPGGAEGRVNMQIVDAAYRSAETGQVVEITRGRQGGFV
jgi:predicted dehydrogenase